VINAKAPLGESNEKLFDRRAPRGANFFAVVVVVGRLARSLAAALIATSMVEGLAPSHASTLIAEVSGDPIGAAGISAGNAISFTTTSLFTDVTISALLYSSTGDPGTGSATVYLTDSIGAGTTTANEIASEAKMTTVSARYRRANPRKYQGN